MSARPRYVHLLRSDERPPCGTRSVFVSRYVPQVSCPTRLRYIARRDASLSDPLPRHWRRDDNDTGAARGAFHDRALVVRRTTVDEAGHTGARGWIVRGFDDGRLRLNDSAMSGADAVSIGDRWLRRARPRKATDDDNPFPPGFAWKKLPRIERERIQLLPRRAVTANAISPIIVEQDGPRARLLRRGSDETRPLPDHSTPHEILMEVRAWEREIEGETMRELTVGR